MMKDFHCRGNAYGYHPMRRIALVSLTAALCLIFSSASVAGELMAGVAVVDITPPDGAPLSFIDSKHGVRWRNRGAHDRLYAKVLALSDGSESTAIVSLDLMGFDPGRIRTLLPENAGHVLFCASHNHLAPATISFTPPDFRYPTDHLDRMEKDIADAVTAAFGSLEAVRIRTGIGQAALSYNKLGGGKGLYLCGRDNPDRIRFEPVDDEVGVIRIDDLDGDPLAVLVHYTAHPVIVWTSEHASAEYPGYMCRHVEETLGKGALCFFLQGACGDTQPFESCSQSWDDAEKVGRLLGDEVVAVCERIGREEPAAPTLALETHVFSIPGRNEAAGQTFEIESTILLIGGSCALVTGPGEFFVDYQLDLKARSPVGHTFFVGYTNGYYGYFPTRRAVEEDWNKWYNHNMWVAVGAGETIIERALETIAAMTAK